MAAAPRLRRAAARLRSALFRVATGCVRLAVPPRTPAGGCLVLKLDALGDHILWLSSGAQEAARYARRTSGRSVLLARSELVEFLSGLGLFDEVWGVDVGRFRRDIVYRVHTQARIRRKGFAQILQMRFAREHLLEDAIVHAVGIRDARGVLGDTHNLRRGEARTSDRWYRPIARLRGDSLRHELERNRLATLALTGVPPAPFPVPCSRLPESLHLPERYVVLAPGAGSPQRCWPAERFIQVAEFIRGQAPGLGFVVVGSHAEAPIGEEIGSGAAAINFCGRLTIRELLEVVRRAALVVSNESAPGHIAAYCRVPSVVVLGGGHFGWFMPYPSGWSDRVTAPRPASFPMDCFGCNWQCRFTRSQKELVPCVRDVTVAAVARELAACLPAVHRPPDGLRPASARG